MLQIKWRIVLKLVLILEAGFKKINQQIKDGQDLILPVGNTGCGKSTLLNALAYGADSLKTTMHTRCCSQWAMGQA